MTVQQFSFVNKNFTASTNELEQKILAGFLRKRQSGESYYPAIDKNNCR